MKQVTFIFLFLLTVSMSAQSIFGKWENRAEDTGKVDSVIEVYEKEGKAYAKIVEITDPNRQDNVCEKCEGENKNKPILGMDILTGLEKDGDEWSGGKILDPKTGKIYKCFITLKKADKLKIRGYIGFSLLGKTRYWYRQK